MKDLAIATLRITSNSFKNRGPIPAKYTCDGLNVNPPLRVDNVPDGTESLAIIVDDPDAPRGTFTHWMIWNIHPSVFIDEGFSDQGIEGINDFGKHEYMGPCPPNGTHRYIFKIYALNSTLDLNHNSRKDALEHAMRDKVLAYGELTGFYEKIVE